jgi:hypothetical protein
MYTLSFRSAVAAAVAALTAAAEALRLRSVLRFNHVQHVFADDTL